MKHKLAVALLLACLATPAGQAQKIRTDEANPNVVGCAYNFQSGANNTYLSFCVTNTGTIPQIETPQGFTQLLETVEGYGICNESPIVAYYDWQGMGDSGNWNAPILVSHNATSVKIRRTTSDGVWTLTQTFTLVPATPAIKVAMALKNNTAAARTAYVVRHARFYPQLALRIWPSNGSVFLRVTLP